jgi:hypothetical protein
MRHHALREVINEGHRGMRLLGLLGAVIVVVAGLAALNILRQDVTDPRFKIQVRPRAIMSKSECHAVTRSVGYPQFWLDSPPPPLCRGAGSAASFVATVTNTGSGGGWVLSCAVHAIGRSGRDIHVTVIAPIIEAGADRPNVTHIAPGARYLEPGQSQTYDWFVAGVAPDKVARYTGSCSYQESFSGPAG